MLICVELKIDLRSTDMCLTVLKSVSVDDVELPDRQKIVYRSCEDGSLVYKLCSDIVSPEDVLSLWNTVDDLIRSIRVAVDAVEKVK